MNTLIKTRKEASGPLALLSFDCTILNCPTAGNPLFIIAWVPVVLASGRDEQVSGGSTGGHNFHVQQVGSRLD